MGKNVSKRKQPPVAQKGFVRITEAQFKQLKQSIYQECVNDVAEDALARVLLVSVCIMQNDFGKLMKKETRLRNFNELFKAYCEKLDAPTPAMLAAKEEFKQKTNMEFIKDE